MMDIQDLSANKLLAISGVLAVVAGALVFVVPSDALDRIAERIGLQDQQVGPGITEPARQKPALSPAVANRQSGRGSSSRLPSKNVAGEEPLLAQAGWFIHSPSPDRNTRPAASGNLAVDLVKRAVLKATSREGGHLLERYLYLDGRTVLLVDGNVTLDR